tara:strand:- start:277 stop:429 length:153 start_codon:yes stop_codon:yes gene_type:complete
MESFLETTILTLYGDAFSPREEFLVLRLFQLAMQVGLGINNIVVNCNSEI